MTMLLMLLTALVAKCAGSYSQPVDVAFKAKIDGTEQRYMLLLPDGFDKQKKHDLMVAFHGHGSDRHQFMFDERAEVLVAREQAASHRMIYVTPDYRAKTSWMGPKAEADVLQILRDLRRKYRVGKVVIIGASMGGSSVLTFAALHPKEIDGVVSMNGTANHLEYENFQDAISSSFGGTKAQIPNEYKRRSAEYWPERLTMPIAFTAGANDDIVPPGSVVRLASVLAKLQPNVLMVYDANGGHSTNEADARKAFEFVLGKVLGIKTQAQAACAYDEDCDLDEKLELERNRKRDPIANERGSSRRWFVSAVVEAMIGSQRRPKPPAPTTRIKIKQILVKSEIGNKNLLRSIEAVAAGSLYLRWLRR